MYSKFLIFTKQVGEEGINVRVEDETVWLTQEGIAKLFDKARTTITEHIQNIFSSGELTQEATCRKYRQVRQEGGRSVSREIPFYNLDMIISVGYRVVQDALYASDFDLFAQAIDTIVKE